MAFRQELDKVNGALRDVGVRVTLSQRGQWLYLRAVLPPGPGSMKVKPYRQEVTVKGGLYADGKGLKLAKAAAVKLWGQVRDGTYDRREWGARGGKTATPQTVGDWVARFKVYWLQLGKCSEETWARHWAMAFKLLPQDAALTAEVLMVEIFKIDAGTHKRKRVVSYFQRLATFAGVEVNLRPYGQGYEVGRSEKERNPPTDEEVIRCRSLVKDGDHRWVYGMIATFGIRPHEVFFLEKTDNPLVWRVTAGKTGPRQISALFPEWVDQWGLMAGAAPMVPDHRRTDGKINFWTYGRLVNGWLRRYGLPFSPYDLRHAYALRTMRFPKISTPMAAKLMGHKLSVHNRTYHRWLSAGAATEMYLEGIVGGPSAPPPLGD